VLSQLFFACKKDEVGVTPTQPTTVSQPGYFVVSPQSSATNGRLSGPTFNTEFDLGILRSSKEFLFMISNGGDEPIFDVTLTSDNTPFEISPKTIKTISGKNQTAVMPLLTVGITHGRQLNGTAAAPVLNKGYNKATIRLSGKTISNKDTVEITGEFSVTIEAKVFSVTFFNGNQEPAFDEQLTYNVSVSKGVKMVNTGNVTIHSTLSYDGYKDVYGVGTYWVEIKNEFDLEPGQEKDITNMIAPVKYGLDGSKIYPHTWVLINDEGVAKATPGISSMDPKFVLFHLESMD
jgi:hypothetical protein